MSSLHITDYLKQHAEERGNEIALIFKQRKISWLELWEAVEASASHVAARVQSEQQSIIGLLLPNSPEFIISYLGIVHAGHIAMPLDPNFKALEITSVTDQMQPAFTVTNEQYKSFFPTHAHVIDQSEIVTGGSKNKPKSYLRLQVDQQVVSMLFTSGTTGKPKATPYTHRNHIWNIEVVSDLWNWNSDDTLLISLPLSHWHGLTMGLSGALYHGNTMYLHERFEPQKTLEELSKGTISLFMHVPIAYLLMTQLETTEQYDLSKVRLCVSGSSYLPPAVWQDFKDRYGQEILERYGASETGLVASNFLDDRKSGMVGHVLPGVEVRVEASGELAMRSEGLFPGYYNNQEATAKNTTEDGFWLTGDIGTFDDNGNLKLSGRIQEKIKKYGYTIYPRDVEWALLKNKGIKDIFVAGIQNAGKDGMSDKMVYFVVSNLETDEIEVYCKKNLPSFWRPDKIVKLDEIPKSRAGKPKLALLREMVTDN